MTHFIILEGAVRHTKSEPVPTTHPRVVHMKPNYANGSG